MTRIHAGTAWVAWLMVSAHVLDAQVLSKPIHNDVGTFSTASSDELTVYELAAAWAPILWFSDYEPSLADPVQPPVRMPVDDTPQAAGKGVVYYRATVVSPSEGVPQEAEWGLQTDDTPGDIIYSQGCTKVLPGDAHPQCLALQSISLVRLQYLFYFAEDIGGGQHPHDLEIAEFWFRISGTTGARRVSLDRIIGYAHGHKAFANKLHPRQEPLDTLSLPVVLLMERGKHAPAPDRSFDGEFTPGFDVNRMVSDAWGTRDVFGSKWMGSRSYSSWMTLGREKRLLAYPPKNDLTVTADVPPSAWDYQLRDFRSSVNKTREELEEYFEDLYIYLEYHGYDTPPQNGPTYFFTFLERFGTGGRVDLGIGPYVSWMGPEFPFIGGHPVVTGVVGVTYQGTGVWWGGSALYSPSVAGFFNVYGGVTWLQCPSCPSGDGIGPEAGVKFRIPIPRAPSPSFVGLRVGLRYPSFNPIRNGRLLLEIGLAMP